jgi:hypothetical protein
MTPLQCPGRWSRAFCCPLPGGILRHFPALSSAKISRSVGLPEPRWDLPDLRCPHGPLQRPFTTVTLVGPLRLWRPPLELSPERPAATSPNRDEPRAGTSGFRPQQHPLPIPPPLPQPRPKSRVTRKPSSFALTPPSHTPAPYPRLTPPHPPPKEPGRLGRLVAQRSVPRRDHQSHPAAPGGQTLPPR